MDIQKYIKVEKVPGGQLEDSVVRKGVMINKDVIAPGKMRRKIFNNASFFLIGLSNIRKARTKQMLSCLKNKIGESCYNWKKNTSRGYVCKY
ncbi:hypothetical protein L3X38_040749 [Prunus dulcis]|uniref:Uncharacterized protein n=1 Tax=Prunus dulcis TaxID=3755 RepID=A0AAD4UT11_PRUDU|nr:hypothetical protein L3X38_040749 [Prunus dulcis]